MVHLVYNRDVSRPFSQHLIIMDYAINTFLVTQLACVKSDRVHGRTTPMLSSRAGKSMLHRGGSRNSSTAGLCVCSGSLKRQVRWNFQTDKQKKAKKPLKPPPPPPWIRHCFAVSVSKADAYQSRPYVSLVFPFIGYIIYKIDVCYGLSIICIIILKESFYLLVSVASY